MDMRDAQRVQQVLDGDSAAYEGLVDAYKGRVYALVVGRLGDFSAAEDVVQDAFVEAYVNLKSLKSPEKFGAWLRGIAVNLANRWVGKRRPMVPLGDPNKEVSPDAVIAFPASPDQVYEDAEMKGTVLKAVSDLPDIYREAVLLHYMEDMTYGQIAVFLDVPESTVTGRLQVARNRLREGLMPLVSETLQEKRPTSRLTRKIMTALPPLLYAAASSSAGFIATLKGSAMFKMIGFLSAGIVGTGLYFGGIEKMVSWRGEAKSVITEQLVFEFSEQGKIAENTIHEIGKQEAGGRASAASSTPSSEQEHPPAGRIRITGEAEDPVISMTYAVQESAHVELRIYDALGSVIATPVFQPQQAGTYTAELDKRTLPRGRYAAEIFLNHERITPPRRYRLDNNLTGKPFTSLSKEENQRIQRIIHVIRNAGAARTEPGWREIQQIMEERPNNIDKVYVAHWAFIVAIQDSTADSLTVQSLIDSLIFLQDHFSAYETVARAMYHSGRFLNTGAFYAQKAIEAYRDNPPQYRTGGLFRGLELLGKLQFKQGHYTEAEKNLKRALDVYREIPAYHGIVRNRWDKGVAETLNEIATLKGKP